MSYLRFIGRRIVLSILSIYAVVTVMFFLINLMVWKKLREALALAQFGGASPEELQRLREGFMEARNLDDPLLERYIGWLIDVTTLKWGGSVAYGEPVIAVLDGRVPRTLKYVIPGVLLAVLLGVVFGLVATIAKDSPLDWSVRLTAYTLFGIPSFAVIIYYSYLSGTVSFLPSIDTYTMAALTVAAALFAGQLRFARTATLEQSGRLFVKMLRAKGTNRFRTARHVLRNAAIPIISMSLAELISVLVLTIYVIEEVLRIPGLAQASLRAVRAGDVALVLWSTLVIVVVGIVANFLQDVIYGYLDPRIETA